MKIQPIVEREFTVMQFADKVGVTGSRIRQLLRAGVLSGQKPAGSRDWWIPESQLEVFRALPDNRGRWPRVKSTSECV